MPHTPLQICVLFLLLIGNLSAPFQPAQAQTRWSEPIQLSETTLDETTIAGAPSLSVDPLGGVHVVWYSVAGSESTEERQSSFRDQLHYRARIDGAWTAEQPIYTQERPFVGDASSTSTGGAGARNTSFILQASLLAGADNQLHMVFGDPTMQWFMNAPLTDVVRSMAILPPWHLGMGMHSRIAGSSDGTLHTLLSAVPPGLEESDAPNLCLTCTDIFHRRSDDGGLTWSRPENLSSAGEFDLEPQIAVDVQDRLHVVWERRGAVLADRSAGTLVYRRSDDQGQSWSEPVALGLSGEGAAYSSLAVAPTGAVLVVYTGVSSGGVFYQYSPDSGTTWSEPGVIPTVLSRSVAQADYNRFSMAVDGNGHIHLLMVGLPPAGDTISAQLLHMQWDGRTWSEPTVMSSGALNPLGPRLVIERGNHLHAVWFTSTYDPANAVEQEAIWYSEALLAAPELAPAPTFTPQPTATVHSAPTPTVLPTVTPLPATTRALETIDGPPLWELRGLQAVGAGLLAVIGLLGLVAWMRLGK